MGSSRNILARELNKLSLINTKQQVNNVKIKSENKYNSTATTAACPHLVAAASGTEENIVSEAWLKAKKYKEVK